MFYLLFSLIEVVNNYSLADPTFLLSSLACWALLEIPWSCNEEAHLHKIPS